MVTRSAPPDLDAVETAIKRIAPLLQRHVEPCMEPVVGKITATDQKTGLSTTGSTGLPPLDVEPIHYATVLTMVGVVLEPGSLAEALWATARELLATRRYCVRLDPVAYEVRNLTTEGEAPTLETMNAIRERYEDDGPLLNDANEDEFLVALEQCDRASLKAQQATIDKLGQINQQPMLLRSPELAHREVVMAWFRNAIAEMLDVARAKFSSYEGVSFPRTRREWMRTTAKRGAELRRRGLSHHEVGSIFCGSDLGSPVSTPRKRAKERARLRSYRAQQRARSWTDEPSDAATLLPSDSKDQG